MSQYYRLRKRYVTLLEVLISIALTVIILMTLTFFYRQVGIIGIAVDSVKEENFRLRYLETRLADILPKTIAANDKKQDFVFFSVEEDPLTKPGSQSLIFTFENGVSLDKEISNHALGRIYLDKDSRLMLAYWPSPKRWEIGILPEMKKELLLEDVEGLRFGFFVPPQKKGKKEIADQAAEKDTKIKETSDDEAKGKPVPSPQGDWHRQAWLKEYESLPTMVRVIVLRKGKPAITFAFPMANAKEHVIYD